MEGSIDAKATGERERGRRPSLLQNNTAAGNATSRPTRTCLIAGALLATLAVSVAAATQASDKRGPQPYATEGLIAGCSNSTYNGDCYLKRSTSVCDSKYEEKWLENYEQEDGLCLLYYEDGLSFSLETGACKEAISKRCVAVGVPDYCQPGQESVLCNADVLCAYVNAGNSIRVGKSGILANCTDNIGHVILDTVLDRAGPVVTTTIEQRLVMGLSGYPSTKARNPDIPVGASLDGVLYSIDVMRTSVENPFCDYSLNITCGDLEQMVDAIVGRNRWEWPCEFAAEYGPFEPLATREDVYEVCGSRHSRQLSPTAECCSDFHQPVEKRVVA